MFRISTFIKKQQFLKINNNGNLYCVNIINRKNDQFKAQTRSKVVQESFYKAFDRCKISGQKVV